MSTSSSSIIQWKKVYQLISGTFYNENEQVIKKKLLDLQKEIELGIDIYKRPSSNSNEELEKLLKEKGKERLIPFAQKLYKFLDLDVNQSFDILCYYLVNEYRGSASSLQNFVSNESLMIKLLNDIWFYYSLERMVQLKVIKCIVEYHESNNHPYRDAFKELIAKIGMEKLRKSFIDQFESLLNYTQQSKCLPGDIFNSPQKLQNWSERKCRELNEILQILLLTCHFDIPKPDEILKLVDLFKLHAFGKQNQYLNPNSSAHLELTQKINFNETAVLMVALSTNNRGNINWMNEVIEKIDEKIISMHHYEEHGPLLLSWMIFKFASKKNESSFDQYSSNYGKLGFKAVQLNVFEYLLKMVNHKQFADRSLISKTVIRCIFDNLSFLCELFNSDGSMGQYPKIYELFAELLKLPSIAKEFCKSDNLPVRTLFDSAVQSFPLDFIPLSIISKSLSQASIQSSSWIMQFLQGLPVYAEQPNDPLYELRKSDEMEEDGYILLNDYQPFQRISDYVIPSETNAIVREEKGKMCVYFLTKLNYFHALHNEINSMLNSIVSFSEIQDAKINRLEAGINLLAALIKRIDNPNEITNEMIVPTEMVFDILEKFKVFQHPPLKIMAACLNVCAELSPYFASEIHRRFINLNIAPSVNMLHYDYKAYSNGNGFELGLVGFYLINIECSTGRYEFLKSYLNFLKKFSKLQIGEVYTIELPGLLFIIREVFNNIHSWKFENEQDKMDIHLFVFEYIHDLLITPQETIKEDASRKLLRDICAYSLLYLDNSVFLLRYISIGTPGLQNFMENESNWFIAADSDLNMIVLNAMRILMQTLRLKETITQDIDVLTPLEKMIYTQPKQRDTLKIIPIVANYTSYPFNRRFSILSCRLLRRFAIEFQSSLTACLDLEADQIRMMFLQRLRDRLESEDLKVAILDFVNACIDKQPGLTEAFFKVSYEQDSRSSFFIKRSNEAEGMCDGIITYMEEFLETVEKDPAKITNDQLKRIMNLFHSLWKQGLQSLVSSLLKKTSFWSSLCSPILSTPISNYQYSQLLNIMGIELFKLREANEENESFRRMIEKFISKDVFKKWLDLVFNLPTMQLNDSSILDETPEWLERLQSFKDFLVLLLKKKSLISLPSDSSKMLLDKAVETLVRASEEIENGNDTRPFIVLSELYLITLNDQNLKYTKNNAEDAQLLKNIEALLKSVTNFYGDLNKRAKESILAIAIKILNLESDEIKNYPSISNSFVRYNLEILAIEFFNIENEDRMIAKSANAEKNLAVILAINLLKKVLLIEEEFYGNCNYWFNFYKIFNRLLSVISLTCQKPSKKLLTEELFDLLFAFANGSYSKNLVYCDFGDYLWMNLLAPTSITGVSLNNSEKESWTSKEWWKIYIKGVQLVTVLLKKEGHLFIKDALFFLGIHEQCLAESLLLAKFSLEPNAMTLIKAVLELIAEVVQYEKHWSADYQLTVHNLMRCITQLLEQSVSLLHRPKFLMRLTEASNNTKLEDYPDSAINEPSVDLLQATNGLIEIITLCSKCLLHFSPNLLNLICDVEFYHNKWIPFIENQFGAPKINSSAAPQLSYGTVLSAVALLVKTLNLQHFAFKQVALNKIPQSEDNNNGNDTAVMATLSDSANAKALGIPSTNSSPISPHSRAFTKSISMTSMSGTLLQSSNELLTQLDSKICLTALEFLLTVLASQSLLVLKGNILSSREKQMIKRELSTELHCLHDFVKKKILKDPTKSLLFRQKMGIYQIINEEVEDEPQPSTSSKAPQSRRSQDLRVNVVRKLHLQQKTPFEIPSSFSPIQHESTPIQRMSNPTTSTSIKRVGFDLASTQKVLLQEDDEPYAVNRGDPSFTGLSFIKFIEEDYLQFISNVFIFICQNEN